MSLGTARGLTALYFTAMTFFVVWPGLVPFARIRPLVLGLPFSMAWIAGWVAASVGVLFLLDRVEARHRPGGPVGGDGEGRAHGEGRDGGAA